MNLKRGFDLICVTLGLPLWLPLLLVTAFLIRWRLGRPLFFSQPRAGLEREPFVLIKFRTMTERRDEDGELLSDEERLTHFGKWLRSTSLDELPELFNVLRGDMSLVGPRPLLLEYLPRYSARHGRRHDVRPGITGLAQVMGRNALSWEEKLDLDVKYLERRVCGWTFGSSGAR